MPTPFRRCALLFLLLGFVPSLKAQPERPTPPPTPKRDVVETMHGVRISDPYRWLEDQQSPETRAWIDAQNAYTRNLLDKLPERASIEGRLTELMRTDSIETPIERNGRYIYSARGRDQDLFVIHLREGNNGADRVLVDPHPLSADHTVSVNPMALSRDGFVFAYGVRHGGADEVEVHFKNLNSREDFSDVMPRRRYLGVALLPSNAGFYYGVMLPSGPRIRYHAFGADTAADREIFGSQFGPSYIASPSVTESGRYLLITVVKGSAADKVEIYLQDLAGGSSIRPLVNDLDARFRPGLAGDVVYLETNWKAPDGRVLRVDLARPARTEWREVVPEAEAAIETMRPVGGKLLVTYLENAHSRLKIFSAEGKPEGEIPLPALGTANALAGRWSSSELFFRFSSLHIPPVIYRYDLKSSRAEEWARVRVPITPEDFQLEQVWYESRDQTRVPMFLLSRKGRKLDGSAPVLLTGYGGFNVSRTPEYSSTAVYWASLGGIYALPNLRGGGEFGERWHRAGMLEHKQNVFDDFLSAAEWLVKKHYTRPEKLAIVGGSNGGLLVGAAITQRPDLFGAAVCSFPLLDMLRYDRFLVARYWVPEYGSAENPDQFRFLYAYSPYHHVQAGTKYPAVLLVSGDSDTRVAPLHARKMTALLQASTASDRPVLLHYDTSAGHSQGRPLTKIIADTSDEISFLLWQLKVPMPASP